MGRIVKAGRLTKETHVVAVPHVDTAQSGPHASFDHDTFGATSPFTDAASFDASSHAVNADDAPAQEPRIDWMAVRAEAEAIVDRAAADAQTLLRQAYVHALDTITFAEERVVALETEARARGHEDGFAAGKAAADAEMAEMIATMHALLESARAQRETVIESAEPELVNLALAVAERVVHQHVSVDRTVVIENVRQALARLIGRETVTLRVNPDDLEIMREHRDAIVASNDVEHLRIVEDQRVDRGGVVIETDSGTIDAKVSTQLREARRAIVDNDALTQVS